MVHRKTLSLPVDILSMAFLEQPMKIRTLCRKASEKALVEGMNTCNISGQGAGCTSVVVKKLRSHNRSKSALSHYKVGMEHNTMNSFMHKSLDCGSTNQEKQITTQALGQCIHFKQASSSDVEIRDENSNSVAHDHNILERFLLQNVDGTPSESINKHLMNNFNTDSFYVDSPAHDEKEVLITQNRLLSPLKSTLNSNKNNSIALQEFVALNTPDDAASITHIPSNPKKKLTLSPDGSSFPTFIACNKIPFDTFEFDVVNKNISSNRNNKPKEYYHQDSNILRLFPTEYTSEYDFQYIPNRLYLPNLCMD